MKSRNLSGALLLGAILWLSGCSDDTTAPGSDMVSSRTPTAAATPEQVTLAAEVRQLAAAAGITPLARPAAVRPELFRLGQMLAFDKILSGNRDISCMSCHLTKLGTTDARSVAVGQGATGLGPSRVHPQNRFVHRSAPALFNLHAMDALTWDGRVFRDPQGVIRTPGANLLSGQRALLDFGPLSALPMMPVLSRVEMRGDVGNPGNELAAIADNDHQKTWKFLMRRLGAIPEYRTMFEAAYPAVGFDNMNFAHAGNAMGAWIAGAFAFTGTPWDRMLAGNNDAMTEVQLRGARSFLGTAKCAQCHSGPTFSDGKFHNVATPQVGPGFGNGADGHDDFGRERKTGDPKHRYQFRTAPLRNVELTAPYGHDGAIVNLRDWVDHYSQPDLKLRNYSTAQLEPLLQTTLQPTADGIIATRDFRIKKLVLTPEAVDEITEFLKALTDPGARNLHPAVPLAVPSGLPVDDLP